MGGGNYIAETAGTRFDHFAIGMHPISNVASSAHRLGTATAGLRPVSEIRHCGYMLNKIVALRPGSRVAQTRWARTRASHRKHKRIPGGCLDPPYSCTGVALSAWFLQPRKPEPNVPTSPLRTAGSWEAARAAGPSGQGPSPATVGACQASS